MMRFVGAVSVVLALLVSSALADVALVPAMTSNMTPSGTVSASSTYPGSACGAAGHQPWQAFGRNRAGAWMANADTGMLGYTFAAPQNPVAYGIVGYDTTCAEALSNRAPKSWLLHATVNGSDTVLDSQTNIVFANGVEQKFPITLAAPASDFWLDVTADNGDCCNMVVTALQFYATGIPPTPPVASGPLIQANVALPLPCPVGKSVNLLGGSPPNPMPPRQNTWAGYDFYVSYQSAMMPGIGLAGCRVFVLGNSIVAGQDVSQLHPFAVNLGIGSDAVADILSRLAAYVSGMGNGGLTIYFDPGINDIHTYSEDAATIIARDQMVLNWLSGPLVYVGIIPSCNATFNAVAAAVNAAMALIVAARPKSVFVDTGPVELIDCYHPTGNGWVNSIVPKVIAAEGLVQ